MVHSAAVNRHDGRHAVRRLGARGRGNPHGVLLLPPSVRDPVRIILAAQIQLRRWRRKEQTTEAADLQRRVREIIAARDALLGEIFQKVDPTEGVDSPHEDCGSSRRLRSSR